MTKIRVNDPCPCKSGKKYKKCCRDKEINIKETKNQRIIYGDEYVSDFLKKIANNLKEEFPDHEVIDVSKVVNNETYKPLQLQHYTKKIIMLIERMPQNEEIFKERACFNNKINYMVLYRGAYQCLELNKNNPDLSIIFDMVNTRLNGKPYEK